MTFQLPTISQNAGISENKLDVGRRHILREEKCVKFSSFDRMVLECLFLALSSYFNELRLLNLPHVYPTIFSIIVCARG